MLRFSTPLFLLLCGALCAQTGRLAEGLDVARYNRTGVAINKTLKGLSGDFEKADAAAMAVAFDRDYDSSSLPGWQLEPRPSHEGVEHFEWRPDPQGSCSGPELFAGWRARFASLSHAKFKLVDLDYVHATGADAVFRAELHGTDHDGRLLTERAFFGGDWRDDFGFFTLAGLRLIRGESLYGPGDLFRDVAAARGIEFFGSEDPRYLPPSDSLKFQIIRHAIGGVSAGDVDGDGDDDVLFTGSDAARLFINQGDGSFVDGTEAAGLAGISLANAALFADFDNDGDQDVYIARFYGPNLLFANQGGGRFVDVTAASGLQQDDMTAVLAAADFNGDGWLDLYLGRFLDARLEVPTMLHYARNGAPNKLYLGRGELGFDDVTASCGADDRGLTLGIAVADIDRDGDQDIYLSNDFGRNVLLRNRGDATFEDVAKEQGALALSGGMSASFGDYDNDGWQDIYVSSVNSNQRWYSQDVNIRGYILRVVESDRREPLQHLFVDLRRHLGGQWDQLGELSLAGNYLLRNRGDASGCFEDTSVSANARPHGWYWSSGFFDIENDGDLDIFAVNGFVTGKKTHDL